MANEVFFFFFWLKGLTITCADIAHQCLKFDKFIQVGREYLESSLLVKKFLICST